MDVGNDKAALTGVWNLWNERYGVLKRVAVHYVSIAAYVVVLGFGEVWVFSVSATRLAENSAYSALSLMFLPAFAISIAVFFVYYSRDRRATDEWLRAFAADVADEELKSEAHGKLKELEGYSDLNFFWAVLTSHGFILTFLFGLANFSVASAFPSVLNAVSNPKPMPSASAGIR